MADDLEGEIAFANKMAANAKRYGLGRLSNRRKDMPVLLLDNVEIGNLEETGRDNFWIYGPFHPLPAFAIYGQPLRDLEAAWDATEQEDLTEEEHDRLHESVHTLMAQLDERLSVRYPSGALSTVRDFKIHKGQWEYKMLD